ncbi:GNAT family N-acetyltransferase [Iamia sp.]|uniref:GNAT family N-acetyltransferase n=1 Tax=Iamia sp. TaxID=2722710 RepID=UPI002CDDBE78|nr:GNAT family N-acetyltransferase [Iamia sp.]HXH55839.1 GNAT family N-acetyltransferase [Iamia sp.]
MPTTRVLTTAQASARFLAEARLLVDRAFAGDLAEEDWGHALGGWHVVVAGDDGDLLAHAAVVPRVLGVGDRPWRTGYVEAVATAPRRQGAGLGSLVMAEAARVVRRNHEMGALSTERHAFYERLGWERWQGPTYVRDGATTIRTEDEDDGVMVLRFGPSAEVDLTASISCEARPGDDW